VGLAGFVRPVELRAGRPQLGGGFQLECDNVARCAEVGCGNEG